MELAGENPFKVRAYENASRTIAGFPETLEEAIANGHLREARGIGDAILANVQELAATGRLALHEELRSRFPPGLRECLGLPGLVVGKVRLLHQSLGIDSLDALERACREGAIRTLKGFGDKSIERLLRGIAVRRAGAGAHRFPAAAAAAAELADAIGGTGLSARVEIAGSLRRRREIVRDVDLVVSAGDPSAVLTAAGSLPGVVEVIATSDSSIRVRLTGGVAADLIV